MSNIKLDRPLFIIGSPRSGTSLLRLIMTSHSQILVPPECGFIIWLHTKYGNWHRADNKDGSKLTSFLYDLFESKKFDTWMLDKKIIEHQIVASQPESYAELCAIVYDAFGMSIRKDFAIWGDKNNFHLNHLDALLSLYKKARFLHIVRDGRDVACSYREVMSSKSRSPYAPKLETNITNIALEWSNNVMKVDSFMTLMPQEAGMTIRYEDLVLNSQSIITTICEWLGIQFEADMLNFYQQNKSKKLEPELTMDWKKRTLLPISDETVGRYTSSLTNEEQDEFLAAAARSLHRFSYV